MLVHTSVQGPAANRPSLAAIAVRELQAIVLLSDLVQGVSWLLNPWMKSPSEIAWIALCVYRGRSRAEGQYGYGRLWPLTLAVPVRLLAVPPT